MSFKKALIASFLLASTQFVAAEDSNKKKDPIIYEGIVSYVVDGDRFILTSKEQQHFIRMKWIDAPNDGQMLNEDARRFLADLIEGKDVMVISHNGEVNGCVYGEVIADAQNYNIEMINAGYANISKGAPKDYIKMAVQAKADKKGIWNEDTKVDRGSGYLTSVDYANMCNFEDEGIVDYVTEPSLKEGREHDRFFEILMNMIIGALLGFGLAKGLNHFDDPRIAREIQRKRKIKEEEKANEKSLEDKNDPK